MSTLVDLSTLDGPERRVLGAVLLYGPSFAGNVDWCLRGIMTGAVVRGCLWSLEQKGLLQSEIIGDETRYRLAG